MHVETLIARMVTERHATRGDAMNIQESRLQAYRDAAAAHGAATKAGDSKNANKAYDDLHSALREITSAKADTSLISLFDDQDLGVQLWAAAHSLEVDEAAARQKLQMLSDADIPLVSMSARYTLMEWKSGKLKFRG